MNPAVWQSLESDGVVRLRIEPDDSEYQGCAHEDDEECHARDNERLERGEGVWGIIGEYHDPATDKWEHADSVWGFIGDDWRGSGYDEDVMQSAIDAYLAATKPLATMLTSKGVGL